MSGKKNKEQRRMRNNQQRSTTTSAARVIAEALANGGRFSEAEILQTIAYDMQCAAGLATGIHPNALPPLNIAASVDGGVVGMFDNMSGLNPSLDGYVENQKTGTVTFAMVFEASPRMLVLRWFPAHLAARALRAGEFKSIEERTIRFASVDMEAAKFYWTSGGPRAQVLAM